MEGDLTRRWRKQLRADGLGLRDTLDVHFDLLGTASTPQVPIEEPHHGIVGGAGKQRGLNRRRLKGSFAAEPGTDATVHFSE
jgi:hypothetical protein